MDFQYIKFETLGKIGRITLNHAEKRNALSLGMLKELCHLLNGMESREDIKVLIIKAAGKVFSSGHDLKEMVGRDKTHYDEVFDTCSSFMQKLQKLPQPVIAQIQGIATAAGCQLVAACDLAVAETGAQFETPGVKIGIFCTTPAIPLVRAIGRKRALEMLFTGRMISAQEAQLYGLVNKVVPLDQLEAETMAMADKIAEASLLTLGIGKRAFYTQVNLTDAQAYIFGSEVIVGNLLTEDAKEGIHAFFEGRKPIWQEK